jgi:hypothetical protein
MGGNKEQKRSNQMAQAQGSAYQKQFEQEQQQRSKEAYDRSNQAWGGANTAYQGFAKTGGAELLEGYPWQTGGGGGGGGGTPGAGDTRFGDVESSYRNFMNTGGVDPSGFNRFQGHLGELAASGGWSPEQIENVNKSIRGYQGFAETGGLDAEAINRMRGLGIFDEFAKTGGISDAERAQLRARGTSVIPAFYNRVREESGRLGRVQGGGGPGQAALMSRLARDQSRGAQEAARETELGIGEQVRQGRQWGTQGLTSAEQTLQDLLSRNKLAGMGGVTDATAMMANSIAQNRLGAAGQGAGNEIGWQGLVSGNKLAGTRGLEGMAESSAARGAAASAASAADAKWRASFLADNMLAGAGGLRGLRTDVPGEVALYDQNRLQSRQIWNQGNAQYQQPEGGGVDWGQIAGAGANAAGAYFGGQTQQPSPYKPPYWAEQPS